MLLGTCKCPATPPHDAVCDASQRLLWLSWFAGHVLADDGGGETPQVPDSINKLSTSLATHVRGRVCTHAGTVALHDCVQASAATRSHKFATSAAAVAADPVVALCSNMFHLVKTQTTLLQNNPHSPLLSPLTVKTLLWYLQRWSRTYLLPNMSEYRRSTLSPNLTRLYGTIHSKDRPGFSDGSGAGSEAVAQLGLSSGDAVAEFVAQTSTLALALWPSEPGCAGQALSTLQVRHCMPVRTLSLRAPDSGVDATHLQSLVANRSVSSVLLTSPTWQALVRASAVVVAGEGATSPAAAALGPLRGLTGLVTDDQRRLVALLVGATKGARLGDDDSLAFGSDGNSNTYVWPGDVSRMWQLTSRVLPSQHVTTPGPVLQAHARLFHKRRRPCAYEAAHHAITGVLFVHPVPCRGQNSASGGGSPAYCQCAYPLLPVHQHRLCSPLTHNTILVLLMVCRVSQLCQGATCPAFVVDPNWLLPVALPMLEKCSHLIRGYGAGHTVTVAALAFTRAFLKAQVRGDDSPTGDGICVACPLTSHRYSYRCCNLRHLNKCTGPQHRCWLPTQSNTTAHAPLGRRKVSCGTI